jgi:hypothetical protein
VGQSRHQLYGRNSVSGTYGYFKEHALCKGDFKNSVNEQPGQLQSCNREYFPEWIGYSGIGYTPCRFGRFRWPKPDSPLSSYAGNAINGSYPRPVSYIYVNRTWQGSTPSRQNSCAWCFPRLGRTWWQEVTFPSGGGRGRESPMWKQAGTSPVTQTKVILPRRPSRRGFLHFLPE